VIDRSHHDVVTNGQLGQPASNANGTVNVTTAGGSSLDSGNDRVLQPVIDVTKAGTELNLGGGLLTQLEHNCSRSSDFYGPNWKSYTIPGGRFGFIKLARPTVHQ
jgi:hypothetical protein